MAVTAYEATEAVASDTIWLYVINFVLKFIWNDILQSETWNLILNIELEFTD